MITVPMKVAASAVSIPMAVTASEVHLAASIGAAYTLHREDTYTGAYEFTPSAEEQTIPTRMKALEQDIVIHAIPNNYGLITYNGSVITVS